MKYIKVPTIHGEKTEIVYNIHDFPYEKLQIIETKTEKGKKKKPKIYYNCSCAFDIESTTITPPMNHNGKYKYEPYAFMYHWQFCIQDMVVFGRTWEDFVIFLDKIRYFMGLTNRKRLVVFIHNLPYEFQFMKEFINIEDIFFKDKRKPLKIASEGIEFRCSYALSNMSLIKFCENSQLCTHFKMQDTFDYSKIRTPYTPLDEMEEGYCYNDVRGLCQCIDTLLQEDDITTLPLTNTGYVRRDYRHKMNTPKLRHLFEKMAMNEHEYKFCRDAFRGGNTHANRFKADKILENVYSFDISSSYPSSIAMDYYPMGKFMACTLDNQEILNYYLDNYCVLLDVTFYNIKSKQDSYIPYIDIAHCLEKSDIVNDNGRVLSADYIRIRLTEIDLKIIRDTYDYDGFIVNESLYAKKGKLPIELRSAMMDFFHAKTLLKDVDGKEYEYMKSKNRLNSTYGMMVTDIAHTEIMYHSDTMEYEEIIPNMEESLEGFYKSRNSFLSYQWGVWVTANSRKRLQIMIDKVGEDIVYIDTDSIKFVGEKHVAEFEELNQQLMKQAEENDIQAYSDRDGKRFYLGTWDNESKNELPVYKRFKTLGAKKYAYELQDGSFHITVSGMGKKKGAKQVGRIENFNIGLTFHDVGRTISWYNDVKPTRITINGETFTTGSNIGIVDTTYTLGVTDDYWNLIELANLKNSLIERESA